jgi:hypothetical protein
MRNMLKQATAACLVLVLFSPVQAQFQVNPALLQNQPALTTFGAVNPLAVPSPVYNPIWNPGWGGYYGMTPAYGYLSGVAELTNANAQYQVTIQQARQANEQTLQMQLQTRRKVMEQMQWEYEHTPSLETQRERDREMNVRRMLNDPPLAEIASGDALNILLEQARRNMLAQIPGPLVPLDPNVLKHINVTDGTTRAGSQVARDTESLRWPLPLQAPQWKNSRDVINSTMATAVMEARSGGIQFETDKKLNDAIRGLDQALDDAVAVMTPTDFIRARRFVTQLQETRTTLGSATASNFLTGKWAARGNNVAELVQNMQNSGLRFAAALPGDDAYYRIVHSAMVAYVGSQAMLSAQGPRMPVNPTQQAPVNPYKPQQ